MHADIEIARLGIVEVDDAIQVLVLRGADIVVVGRHLDIAVAQLVCNMLDHTARFVDFVEDAARAANIFAVA